jgi:hypothetical protein
MQKEYFLIAKENVMLTDNLVVINWQQKKNTLGVGATGEVNRT